jgi:hypothetical protein
LPTCGTPFIRNLDFIGKSSPSRRSAAKSRGRAQTTHYLSINISVFATREGRFMARIEYEVMNWIENSQPYEWAILLMGVIVIGAICMKSASNKSNF